jgi:hypothetical protein
MAIRSDLGVGTPTFRGGMTHVVHPRGPQANPVVWPGCVCAWL